MPPTSFSEGPMGTNRVSLEAQHLVRYWRDEMGCSEDELRERVAAVGDRRRRPALPRPPAACAAAGSSHAPGPSNTSSCRAGNESSLRPEPLRT